MATSQRRNSREPWLYDLVVVGAVWFLYDRILSLERPGHFDDFWEESATLGAVMLGLYLLHLTGLALKLPPQSHRLHRRRERPPQDGFAAFLRGRIMTPLIGIPQILQFVLWYFLLSHGLIMVGLPMEGASAILPFLLILVAAFLPCWAVARLLQVERGKKEPFPLIPGARYLEIGGDLCLAAVAVVLILPLLVLGDTIMTEVAIEALGPVEVFGAVLAALIFLFVFYVAPRLPLIIEDLPDWRAWLWVGTMVLIYSVGVILSVS